MESSLDERDLAAQLGSVLDRVRDGERIVVERDGVRLAILVPAAPRAPVGITGRELAERIGDLPMPGDGFADDIESARRRLRHPSPPAWPD